MTYVPVDYCLPAAAIALRLIDLVQEVVEEEGATPVPDELNIETRIAMEDNALETGLMDLGHFSPFTCPECHGALLQLRAGRFLRFRCHVGHAYSARSLLVDLSESLDDALANTLRALDESIMLMEHIAEHLRADKAPQLAVLYTHGVLEARKRAEVLRQLILQGPLPNLEVDREDSPGAAEALQ